MRKVSGDLVLVAIKGTRYETKYAQLRPGNTLLLYTGGVTVAPTSWGTRLEELPVAV